MANYKLNVLIILIYIYLILWLYTKILYLVIDVVWLSKYLYIIDFEVFKKVYG